MTDKNDTYRSVTPYLIVGDADAELTFLERAFAGRVVSCQRRDTGEVMHAEVTIGDSMVMLGQASAAWPAKPAALYLWLSHVDAAYRRALDAGATSESAPEDKPYGHRSGGVVDPNGVTWWIASPVE